ncbi:hypothetical protein [Paenibacillus spongiae]|uniref:Uncharacterized protein n=1 Tax=Paenibacillus spongiae TaxID=2909671 RepID=A0ABY5S0D3_9BACL|nr:hypothetical protein [Paenibacillus spongiae]UVI27286.1 hypothetical protein L1F29_17545 [Paenibacillus spongiae]
MIGFDENKKDVTTLKKAVKTKRLTVARNKKTVEREIQTLAKIIGTQNVGIACFKVNGKFRCFFSFGPQPG